MSIVEPQSKPRQTSRHKTFKLDDIGNRDRFEEWHGGTVKYVDEAKTWVQFSDIKGWEFVRGPFKLTTPVVRDMLGELSKSTTEPSKEALAWASKSQSKAFQKTMLELAASFMDVSINDFDTNPYMINAKNGIVDLKTQILIPHSPDHLHLKKVNARYVKGGTPPTRWLKALNEIFEGNQNLIDYIQVALGYSILGLSTEHCFFICHGNGRNGKGIVLDTVAWVLGTYACNVEFEMFLHKDKVGVREQEAVGRLKGRRFALASETSDSSRLKESLVKRLTGGDSLTGAVLHASTFEFQPTHTIWLACNHRPANRDGSVAMWERVKVIPFKMNFVGEDQEKQLKDTLRKEADGIFGWLVEGAAKYLQHGLLDEPQVMKEAIQDYRDANDPLSIFIREELRKDPVGTNPQSKLGVKDCYARYLEWWA